MLLHCPEDLRSLLSLNALLAVGDQGVVGDDIGQSDLLVHCTGHLHSLLGLHALHASADQGALGEDIGQHCMLLHFPEHLAMIASEMPLGWCKSSELASKSSRTPQNCSWELKFR